MTRDLAVTRRTAGKRISMIAGTAALVLAAFVAYTESMPAFGVYDGAWMILWGMLAVVAVAPVVWRWPRQRSLGAVTLAAVVGCWMPLVISALRHQIPILARLKGAWVLAGAGVVGLATPLGVACLWLALREHRAAGNG
jgi:hypothetical protein